MKRYLTKFEQGTQYVNVLQAVTTKELHKGVPLSDDYLNHTCVKFVPASGAATRLFKDLYEYQHEKKESTVVDTFFNRLEDFGFAGELHQHLGSTFTKDEVLKTLLQDPMHYGSKPKALLSVHQYEEGTRTPLEEHIYEGIRYLDKDDINLYFTVSEAHELLFLDAFKTLKDKYPTVDFTYSFQKSHTDTPAVDLDNRPFLLEDDSILYRPGGHGALIENLNDIDADIIFIKNIDNVCHQDDVEDTVYSKRLLASIGLDVKKQIDEHLSKLLHDTHNLDEITRFLKETLHITYDSALTKEMAIQLLHRPLRVCGVVKNEGEPGGGPFVVDDGEYTSLQICEMSELNQEDPEVQKIIQDAEFFNPVDLVCFVRDYQGHTFNLLDYVEDSRYFISQKTHQGKPLKALEHPGLWNGAMHHWNTVFVEVPITTFNPIKTVLDLLRDGHQPNKR